MQKLKADLLKYIGDPDVVDIAMRTIIEHIGTVACETQVDSLDYNYGDSSVKQEINAELERQMVYQIVSELMNQDLIEMTEEYSYVYQAVIKKASIRLLKKVKSTPRHILMRY